MNILKTITITKDGFDEAVHKALDRIMDSGKECNADSSVVAITGLASVMAFSQLKHILFPDEEINSQEDALREAINGSRD